MNDALNGFNHPIELPDNIYLDYSTPNVLAELEQARLGSVVARDKLIIGFSHLVLSKVKIWLGLFPAVSFMSDDMVSEGFVAVADAVDALIDDVDEDGYPTEYVKTAIINRIANLLEDENTIRIPRSANEGPAVFAGYDKDMCVDGGYGVIDLEDTLFAICETQQDWEILKLRAANNTDEETAAILGISRTSVQFSRAVLAERYKQHEAEENYS